MFATEIKADFLLLLKSDRYKYTDVLNKVKKISKNI